MIISCDQKARALLAEHDTGEALALMVGQSAGCCHIPRVISRWLAVGEARADLRLHLVGEVEGIAVFVGKRLLPYLSPESMVLTAAGVGRRRLVPAGMSRIRTALMFETAGRHTAE